MIAPRLRPSRASTRAPGACEDDAGVLRTSRGADRNAMGWRYHSRFCPPGYAWQAPRELRSIQAGGRGHFYVAVSSPATMYCATVQSFDKVALETPRFRGALNERIRPAQPQLRSRRDLVAVAVTHLSAFPFCRERVR